MGNEIKIVGHRTGKPASSANEVNRFLHTVRELRQQRGICIRGVYRFKTHEEANTWTLQMLVKSSLAARR